MIPIPRIMAEKIAQGKAGRIHSWYRLVHRPAIKKANGTKVEAYPKKRVGGWITIQIFWSRGFKPVPSSGIKSGLIWNIGELDTSLKRIKGELPSFRSPITTPRIIDTKKACTSANTTITGPSQDLLVWIKIQPKTTFQKIHKIKAPS